ncbi:hypothetical protein [Rhodopseudomonas sp. RCAM05734]|uniref:hypothetical protein n=1 Tax=Rhodopseudomonas sp. RCAM05734 TaxID=3457549 RepID=UPI004044F4FA
MFSDSDIDRMHRTGQMVDGAGTFIPGAEHIVGICCPGIDGLVYVFCIYGDLLNVVPTQQEADAFINNHWREDGSVDPTFVPIKRQ